MTTKEHPRYTEIKTAMLVHVPFFSSLLFDMMEVHVGKFPEIFGSATGAGTAGTDGKNIWFDEDFLSKLKLPEAVFVMCHEIGHAMWMHMARGKHFQEMGFEGEKFDPHRWNVAADYVINDMLVKSNIGTMPNVGLIDPKYTNTMLVDDVYRDLKNNKDYKGQDTIDVHVLAQAKMNEAEMKRVVQTALDASKSQGKCPAALERFATELLRPEVTWQERLRYHVTRAVARDSTTWRTPHRRRMVTQGVYFPSYTGFGAGEVVIAVDTSGSVSQAELNRYFSELDEILMTCKPERLWLIGCDAAIGAVHELSSGDSLKGQKIDLKGGGGTDFRPVFEWIRNEGVEPSALVYFTDMYGSFPDKAPDYPVIWCKTTDQKGPWGEEIRVKIKE